MQVPKGGFYYFLNHKTQFELHFKLFVIRQMATLGLDVLFAPRAVNDSYELWLKTSSIWGRDLKMRVWDNEGPPTDFKWNPVTNYAGALSALKLTGQLLWCLNHCKPVANIFLLSQDRALELSKKGFFVPHHCLPPKTIAISAAKAKDELRSTASLTKAPSLLETYPNELTAFRYVEFIFWNMQFARNEKARIDLSQPPMTRHYLTNLCYYLKCGNLSAENLYMIFKTFDLMGLELPG
ncbi:MAG: hypothetical protein KGO94_10700 [Alphaproteobacteria bacterium]|nr:hypothetical protein [Alphaproteobacteria bacterium]